MRLYIFKRNPKRGTWDLIKTLALHEHDTPVAYRTSFYGTAEVWMIEADTRREATETLERCEQSVMGER